jgi:acyl-CoA reductase-like NAD-dependent aldehyde dehydrogenase
VRLLVGPDLARVAHTSHGSGIVWVNSSPVLHPRGPFGGCKSSGIGCENGDQGLQGWCQLHSICVAK